MLVLVLVQAAPRQQQAERTLREQRKAAQHAVGPSFKGTLRAASFLTKLKGASSPAAGKPTGAGQEMATSPTALTVVEEEGGESSMAVL